MGITSAIAAVFTFFSKLLYYFSGDKSRETISFEQEVANAEREALEAHEEATQGKPGGLERAQEARAKLKALRQKASVLGLLLCMAGMVGSCTTPPPIVPFSGECERAVATETNLPTFQAIALTSKPGDVLISGTCYREFLQIQANLARYLAGHK